MVVRVIYRLLSTDFLLELELFLSAETLLKLELPWDWTPTTSQSQGDTLYSTVQLADWSMGQELRLARIAKEIRAFSRHAIGPLCGSLILNQNLLGSFEYKNGPLSSSLVGQDPLVDQSFF